jgi:glutaconate CoA-transferase subunit B
VNSSSEPGARPWRDAEYVVVNLARAIRPNDVVFSGVNSVLPMAACILAKHAYDFDFTYLSVAGGIDVVPKRLPRSSTDPALLEGTPAIFSNEDFYDLATRGKLDLIYLGAAQVDARGRTNVSAIGEWAHPKVRLPGGGGAAVMMPTAPRVAVWRTEHSTRTLVEKLDFITAAGNTVVLVTPYAVFERDPSTNERFHLASYRTDATPASIAAKTGFAFDTTRAMPTPPLSERERAALDEMDALDLLENELPLSR